MIQIKKLLNLYIVKNETDKIEYKMSPTTLYTLVCNNKLNFILDNRPIGSTIILGRGVNSKLLLYDTEFYIGTTYKLSSAKTGKCINKTKDGKIGLLRLNKKEKKSVSKILKFTRGALRDAPIEV